ncbi:response regulator [Mucilaginibacter gynuensis]|uniref:Response regulator n=1 Tax=Mucilaginibacter gynuensis TaxID=1302236 RepID=A0ABP8GDG9_9SPHI
MCRVIVIDDNPMDHLIMRKTLERFDIFHDALFSFSGEAIIAFLEECYDEPAVLPDLIFLDLNMPFSGRAFLQHMEVLYKSLHKQPAIYILSSSIDPADKELVNAYEFVKDFLVKPVSTEALFFIESAYRSEKRLAS